MFPRNVIRMMCSCSKPTRRAEALPLADGDYSTDQYSFCSPLVGAAAIGAAGFAI